MIRGEEEGKVAKWVASERVTRSNGKGVDIGSGYSDFIIYMVARIAIS